MRTMRLIAFALAVYGLLIPLFLIGLAVLFCLGLIVAIGTTVGVLSLLSWQALGVPDLGGTTLAAFGVGAGAFVLLALVWDRVFALAGWIFRDRRDEPFHG